MNFSSNIWPTSVKDSLIEKLAEENDRLRRIVKASGLKEIADHVADLEQQLDEYRQSESLLRPAARPEPDMSRPIKPNKPGGMA